MKKGQNPKYEKSFFQGANEKDRSGFWFSKTPDHIKTKSIARKSKKKLSKKK